MLQKLIGILISICETEFSRHQSQPPFSAPRDIINWYVKDNWRTKTYQSISVLRLRHVCALHFPFLSFTKSRHLFHDLVEKFVSRKETPFRVGVRKIRNSWKLGAMAARQRMREKKKAPFFFSLFFVCFLCFVVEWNRIDCIAV